MAALEPSDTPEDRERNPRSTVPPPSVSSDFQARFQAKFESRFGAEATVALRVSSGEVGDSSGEVGDSDDHRDRGDGILTVCV